MIRKEYLLRKAFLYKTFPAEWETTWYLFRSRHVEGCFRSSDKERPPSCVGFISSMKLSRPLDLPDSHSATYETYRIRRKKLFSENEFADNPPRRVWYAMETTYSLREVPSWCFLCKWVSKKNRLYIVVKLVDTFVFVLCAMTTKGSLSDCNFLMFSSGEFNCNSTIFLQLEVS